MKGSLLSDFEFIRFILTKKKKECQKSDFFGLNQKYASFESEGSHRMKKTYSKSVSLSSVIS